MELTAEISMYPLHEDYEPPILNFIERLRKNPNVQVSTNAMSTQVTGPYDVVHELLRQEMRTSFARYGKAIMVVKFIPGALPIFDPPITNTKQ